MYTSLLQLGMSVIISGVGWRSTRNDTSFLLSARKALSITSARIKKKNGAINRKADARRFRHATSAAYPQLESACWAWVGHQAACGSQHTCGEAQQSYHFSDTAP
jgi:hypothetical protein